MGTMERLIEDISDPNSEKAALQFLGRCVTIFGAPEGTAPAISGVSQTLPGFERFIYERLIPATFRVLSLPGFSIKDGQLLTANKFLKFSWSCADYFRDRCPTR
jgi:exportin-T